MSDRRQKTQPSLAFDARDPGEARADAPEGIEALRTRCVPEGPASAERLMEEVCEQENLKQALQRVRGNQGSAGIDGRTVDDLPTYLKAHWPEIRDRLLTGTYRPQPVRRVEIPKPDGGTRALGIPTALDRFIQQALLQVLQRRWDATFSEHSHGFRPNRSAHQAVARAQQYIAEGYGWVVDLDPDLRGKLLHLARRESGAGRGQTAVRLRVRSIPRVPNAAVTTGVATRTVQNAPGAPFGWFNHDREVLYVQPRTGLIAHEIATGASRVVLRNGDGGVTFFDRFAESPLGGSIAYSGTAAGSGLKPGTGRPTLRVFDAAVVRELVTGAPGERFTFQCWTPDGRGLLFTRYKVQTMATEPHELWLVSVNGSDARSTGFTVAGHTHANSIVIHPRGNAIAFTAGEFHSELWRLSNFLPSASEPRGFE